MFRRNHDRKVSALIPPASTGPHWRTLTEHMSGPPPEPGRRLSQPSPGDVHIFAKKTSVSPTAERLFRVFRL